MSRKAERAFSQACASSFYEDASQGSRAGLSSSVASKDTAAETTKAPTDAIKRILDAWEKKDYFGLLQLPVPTADDLGEEGRGRSCTHAASCPHDCAMHACTLPPVFMSAPCMHACCLLSS